MAIGSFTEWRKLPVALTELCINTTLRCGQTFRWRQAEEGEWHCTLHGRALSLKQDSAALYYRSYTPAAKKGAQHVDDTEALVRHYFNLEYNLSELYEQWATADKNFKAKALHFTGIRILQQDAWEALVSFICSSNNNISRISQMVEKLCVNYGPFIGQVDERKYYDFPSPSALAVPGVEARLRELGFGYRAKYIYRTAVIVANDHEDGWLDTLRNPERPAFGEAASSAGPMTEKGRQGYREAHEKLLDLQGVGPKVSDCVCLMGLGWGESVPVDTHVWQIAQRDYKFGKGKHKTLNKTTYDAIANHFRKLWGQEAGWAHSVLFTADLKSFADRLKVKTEIKEEASSIEPQVKVEANADDERNTEVSAGTSVKREISEHLEIKTEDILKDQEIAPSTKRRRTRRG